jgi:hypothetical protein
MELIPADPVATGIVVAAVVVAAVWYVASSSLRGGRRP